VRNFNTGIVISQPSITSKVKVDFPKKVYMTQKELIYVLNNYSKIVIPFSGGKDSTLIVHLTLTAYERSRKNAEIHVVSIDTYVEIPWMKRNTYAFLQKISEWALEKGYKIYPRIVYPSPKQTFWVNLVGRGYGMPHSRFRWCVDRLKLRPMNNFLREINPDIIFLGSRMDESKERKKNLKRRNLINKWMDYKMIKGLKAYLPIVDWSIGEVWGMLLNSTTPWGDRYLDLQSLYINTEPCTIDYGVKCGGTRFGCWVCSLIKKDKALTGFMMSDDTEISTIAKNLLNFKEYLKEITWDYTNRYTKEDGKPGKLKLEVRKEILDRLIVLQDTLRISVIRPFEIFAIQQIWEEEKIRMKGL